MTGRLLTRVVAPAARRIPGVRRLPVFGVIAVCEVALLTGEHVRKLEPAERRRALELIREGRGRARNLPQEKQSELAELIAKTELRQLLRSAVERLSPVPIPRRLLPGSARDTGPAQAPSATDTRER